MSFGDLIQLLLDRGGDEDEENFYKTLQLFYLRAVVPRFRWYLIPTDGPRYCFNYPVYKNDAYLYLRLCRKHNINPKTGLVSREILDRYLRTHTNWIGGHYFNFDVFGYCKPGRVDEYYIKYYNVIVPELVILKDGVEIKFLRTYAGYAIVNLFFTFTVMDCDLWDQMRVFTLSKGSYTWNGKTFTGNGTVTFEDRPQERIVDRP